MERKLIDVSYHQGEIDWQRVKGNVDGVILRCGYGSNMEKQDDKRFSENVNGCIANGIPFGVYIYSYAKTVEAAESEAAHVLRLVEPIKDKLSYPVYLDLEEAGTEAGAAERALAFGRIIEAKGFCFGIYANQSWWNACLKDEDLGRFTKWVAKYGADDGKPHEKPNIAFAYDIWQYSSKGSVPGISGNVDMNICYRDFPGEICGADAGEGSGGNGNPEPAPEAAPVPEPAPAAAEEAFGVVHGTGVHIRNGAGTNYAVIGTAENGLRVRIWKEENGWYMVDNGKWIHSSLVQVE